MQALWMILASLAFSVMSVCIKYASVYYSSMEILMYRGLVGIAIFAVLMWLRRIPLGTPVIGMHIKRNLAGVIAMSLWFYSIVHMPFATAVVLNSMSSVWLAAIVLLLSWWQTRTLLHPKLFAAVLLGFAGVVLLLDPRGHHAQAFALWPVVAGLTAGVLAAIAYMQVQSLGQAGEPNTRTVFYFSIGTALMGLVGCLVFDGGLAMPRQGNTLGWLLAVGVLAAIGQWCLTRAYSRGATLVVANLQYLGLVFSALMGVWLFNDKLSLINWLGIATIIMSSIAATILRPKQSNTHTERSIRKNSAENAEKHP